MPNSIKKGPSAIQPAPEAAGVIAAPTGLAASSDLFDTTANVSYASDVNNEVWGEASFAGLWDEAESDVFNFRAGSPADFDGSDDLQAGDRIALDWGAAAAGSTLTLVIGPSFSGAGQLIIHADGNQTFIATDSATDSGGQDAVDNGGVSGGGGGDC